MTILYTIDHSRIPGYLRNYDPVKQYFCLLPHNDTSRPLTVPQEYLIHFDDFLLPCKIPTQTVKPLAIIKHLVSPSLTDKDTTYYTALSKPSHSYSKLLVISAKVISHMVPTENKSEHRPPTIEHTSPVRKTLKKLSSVLRNCTIRDFTQLLNPFKRNPSDFFIIFLTHLIHCFDRTHKLLQSLDLDSQRITQSSRAIQSALESVTTFLNSTNLQ